MYMLEEDPSRAHKWEASFAHFYDITYTEARDNASQYKSPRLDRVFNLNENVRFLRRFAQSCI